MRPPMSARSGLRRGKTPAARNCRTRLLRMTPHSLSDRIASLPKAELHLHLEGSIQPATVCGLTARHGVVMTEEEVTLSIGVMLLRNQRPEANFEAILRATEPLEGRGLRFRWVFDAARQFGVY